MFLLEVNALPIIIVLIILAIVIALLIANIRIGPQATAQVVERLGSYKATWNTGIHFKIPIIERVAKKLTLMEQVSDFPPSPLSRRIT